MSFSRAIPTFVAAFAGAALILTSAIAGETPTASAWSPGANSRARLLAAGGPEPGTSPMAYRAGIEIELKNGAHTYWRQPGDAGVPPNVSFEGSRNLKSARLRFPAPVRIDEAGLQVLGYRDNVILPIEATPENESAPVHLAVRFTYAACEKICIPAEASAALDLKPDEPQGPDAGRLTLAAVMAPERVANGDALSLALTPLPGRDKPAWRVTVERPHGPWRDLFAEGPEGWFFETRQNGDGFELILDDRPREAKGKPQVTLTLAGPRDYETTVDLPTP